MFRKALIGILLTGVGLLTILAWQRLEHYQEWVDEGWSARALHDPYLAAKRFLATLNAQVVTVPHISQLGALRASDVLIVPNAGQLHLESQRKQVLDWVADGGALIIGSGSGEDPPVLTELGFNAYYYLDMNPAIAQAIDEDMLPQLDGGAPESLSEILRLQKRLTPDHKTSQDPRRGTSPDDPICRAAAEICSASENPVRSPESLVTLNFDGLDGLVTVDFPGLRLLHHPLFDDNDADSGDESEPFYFRSSRLGVRFAQMHWGDGLVSVIADMRIWENGAIGHFDHAYLLQILASGFDRVVILSGQVVPPLGEWLWRHFYEAIVLAALLLAAFLLYRGQRFGGAFAPEHELPRSSRLRLEARGQFHWRHGHVEALLDPVQRHILKRASQRWPDFDSLDATSQCQRMAIHAGLDAEQVREAMDNADQGLSESRFTEQVMTLQTIRNSL